MLFQTNIKPVDHKLASNLAYVFDQFKTLHLGEPPLWREDRRRRMTYYDKKMVRRRLRNQLIASLLLLRNDNDRR